MAAGCDRLGIVPDAGRSGTVSLIAGTVTVAAPAVTASTLILLTSQPGTAPLALAWVSNINPGTGFTITSLNVTDTSKIAWFLVN